MWLDITEFETRFLELVELVETGQAKCVVVTRGGQPIVQLLPYA